MQVQIARPSVASLLVEASFRGQGLSTATGFCVEQDGRHFLVTNWHVASGRDPASGGPLSATGGLPDELQILHNREGQLGAWIAKREPLYDSSGNPRWLEHPTHRRAVDVVALPLTQLDDVALFHHQIVGQLPEVASGVARPLSIIGFPFGVTGGGALGVWVQGTIATEPTINFNDLPAFLIDSRTRSGQSGSPVIFYADGGMVPMADGSTAVMGGPLERLFGVYSGRINDQSDLGFVWRVDALTEIVSHGVAGQV